MNTGEKIIIQELSKFQTPKMLPQYNINPNSILEEAPKLIKRIKTRDPEQCSDQFKIQSVQFFIQYYTTRMFMLAPIPIQSHTEKIQKDVLTGPPKSYEVDQKSCKNLKLIRLLIWNSPGKC